MNQVGGNYETGNENHNNTFGYSGYVRTDAGTKVLSASERVFELKYGSQYPAGHSYSVADMNWIQKIEKETNRKVKITPPLVGYSHRERGEHGCDQAVQ
jgi:hypothetical protein